MADKINKQMQKKENQKSKLSDECVIIKTAHLSNDLKQTVELSSIEQEYSSANFH